MNPRQGERLHLFEYGERDDEAESSYEPFTVSSNAVVVNIASAEAIAAATQYLIDHVDERLAIGRAGRSTVEAYFTVERQMQQYTDLYRELAITDIL